MLVDEARLSSRVRHANVVATLDVIEAPGEIALVMEYVHGVSFADLIDRARDRGESIPVAIAATSRRARCTACTPRTKRSTSRASRCVSSTATSRRRTCSSAATESRA